MESLGIRKIVVLFSIYEKLTGNIWIIAPAWFALTIFKGPVRRERPWPSQFSTFMTYMINQYQLFLSNGKFAKAEHMSVLPYMYTE